jgi:hypothetical protein
MAGRHEDCATVHEFEANDLVPAGTGIESPHLAVSLLEELAYS